MPLKADETPAKEWDDTTRGEIVNNEVKLSSLCNEVKVKPSVCRHHIGRVILLVIMQFGIWWRKIDVRCFLSISPGVVLLHQTVIRFPPLPHQTGAGAWAAEVIKGLRHKHKQCQPGTFLLLRWMAYLFNTNTHKHFQSTHIHTHPSSHLDPKQQADTQTTSHL